MAQLGLIDSVESLGKTVAEVNTFTGTSHFGFGVHNTFIVCNDNDDITMTVHTRIANSVIEVVESNLTGVLHKSVSGVETEVYSLDDLKTLFRVNIIDEILADLE